jgi:hypothetical protein
MSTLRVDQIQTTAGKPILNSTGSILQIVNSNTLGFPAEITTTSSTYVTTGLSVTITPTSSTSKLLVEFVGNGKFINGPGDDGVSYKIYRDGNALNSNAGDNLLYRSDSNTNNHHLPCCITHYVNANSTSATTFTLFFSNQWGGTGVISGDWGVSQFTVMEISA